MRHVKITNKQQQQQKKVNADHNKAGDRNKWEQTSLTAGSAPTVLFANLTLFQTNECFECDLASLYEGENT